jgi:hypothetical protein
VKAERHYLKTEKTLRKVCGLVLVLGLVAGFTTQVCAQKNSPPPKAAPLVLTGAIPMPNVKGRIGHFGFDPGAQPAFCFRAGE